MKQLLLLPLILLTAQFQYEPKFPGCSTCGVIGYIDIAPTTITLSNTDLQSGASAIEGWGFEKYSGAPVDRLDIFVEDNYLENVWHPVKQKSSAIDYYFYRPDVETVFSSTYPNIYGRSVGFVKYLDSDLPLGAHRFTILIWKGPYHYNQVVTWNIVK